MRREAKCLCGRLRARVEGEPVYVCHCLACQQRMGSAFSYNACFGQSQVLVDGGSMLLPRISDEGRTVAAFASHHQPSVHTAEDYALSAICQSSASQLRVELAQYDTATGQECN